MGTSDQLTELRRLLSLDYKEKHQKKKGKASSKSQGGTSEW
jgi:hypothetical protein